MHIHLIFTSYSVIFEAYSPYPHEYDEYHIHSYSCTIKKNGGHRISQRMAARQGLARPSPARTTAPTPASRRPPGAPSGTSASPLAKKPRSPAPAIADFWALTPA